MDPPSETPVRQCPQCGKTVPIALMFCPYCGFEMIPRSEVHL